jgi:hypothetical protein
MLPGAVIEPKFMFMRLVMSFGVYCARPVALLTRTVIVTPTGTVRQGGMRFLPKPCQELITSFGTCATGPVAAAHCCCQWRVAAQDHPLLFQPAPGVQGVHSPTTDAARAVWLSENPGPQLHDLSPISD